MIINTIFHYLKIKHNFFVYDKKFQCSFYIMTFWNLQFKADCSIYP
jgi:hypothetical protein